MKFQTRYSDTFRNWNEKLSAVSTGDINRRHYIDTLKHPYLQSDMKTIWPAIPYHEPAAQVVEDIIEYVYSIAADFLAGCEIALPPDTARDDGDLLFVRLHSCQQRHFLFIFRVSMRYLGGASELKREPSQDCGPMFETDRIYYNSLLIPVDRIDYRNGLISETVASPLPQASYKIGTTAEKWRQTVELFDQVDFSHLEQWFVGDWLDATWKPGRVFAPFKVENLALALNMPLPDPKLISVALPYFERLLNVIESKGTMHSGAEPFPDLSQYLDPEDLDFWVKYYSLYEIERVISQGGNPHWYISLNSSLYNEAFND